LFKRFIEGSEDIKDDPWSRNPCTAQNPRTAEKVCEIMA
jgi:hypothetical protein